ncbi:hypothetical protein JNW91_01425 [Micromonospora sp. STR1_7]|uniref:Uncharacterized protein n=1 Tax=Micromonospora parastrephiae TaxID=2806101 RepID=A0ABS1XN39_9ACTN|nr:hypothetical protein [Micromonospora parastrephiae]MBM0230653.1 hypothetical protein [Micromonospora parastrephiae]
MSPQDIQATATGQSDVGGAFNGAIVKLAAANAPLREHHGLPRPASAYAASTLVPA